ncbi:MAG: Ppx/GppA family phosphatase [Syntrophomonadaceae bacterium]|jgi:exopolyphosphatase/guanosine-5'-triphosphate,3'-diphosphate pyrophosphatase|nr:Ppx/GppA family phosphatase [Syntrophomonadaceae bacterium]
MRLAAVDVGTNSCRLLIAEAIGGKLSTILKETVTTRLGEGQQDSGWLRPSAINRTLDCLLDFQALIKAHRVSAYRIIATSAVREAANREDFQAIIEEAGIKLDIVDGKEEALLSHLGVERSLQFSQPPLVIDVGGGSTEFICPGDPFTVKTLPVGAVKATEGDWSAGEIWSKLREGLALREEIRDHPMVMVGGTPTTLVAIKESLAEYDAEMVHGHILTRPEVEDLYAMLDGMPLNLRRRLPGLQPERADIVVKGTLIILLIMEGLQKKEITVSESDLLEGIIWQLAASGNRR